jgi:hypothetical protein
METCFWEGGMLFKMAWRRSLWCCGSSSVIRIVSIIHPKRASCRRLKRPQLSRIAMDIQWNLPKTCCHFFTETCCWEGAMLFKNGKEEMLPVLQELEHQQDCIDNPSEYELGSVPISVPLSELLGACRFFPVFVIKFV